MEFLAPGLKRRGLCAIKKPFDVFEVNLSITSDPVNNLVFGLDVTVADAGLILRQPQPDTLVLIVGEVHFYHFKPCPDCVATGLILIPYVFLILDVIVLFLDLSLIYYVFNLYWWYCFLHLIIEVTILIKMRVVKQGLSLGGCLTAGAD